jgi:hypothetical protein
LLPGAAEIDLLNRSHLLLDQGQVKTEVRKFPELSIVNNLHMLPFGDFRMIP